MDPWKACDNNCSSPGRVWALYCCLKERAAVIPQHITLSENENEWVMCSNFKSRSQLEPICHCLDSSLQCGEKCTLLRAEFQMDHYATPSLTTVYSLQMDTRCNTLNVLATPKLDMRYMFYVFYVLYSDESHFCCSQNYARVCSALCRWDHQWMLCASNSKTGLGLQSWCDDPKHSLEMCDTKWKIRKMLPGNRSCTFVLTMGLSKTDRSQQGQSNG